MKKSTAPLCNTKTLSNIAMIIPSRQLKAARPIPERSRFVKEPTNDITKKVADAVTNACVTVPISYIANVMAKVRPFNAEYTIKPPMAKVGSFCALTPRNITRAISAIQIPQKPKGKLLIKLLTCDIHGPKAIYEITALIPIPKARKA